MPKKSDRKAPSRPKAKASRRAAAPRQAGRSTAKRATKAAPVAPRPPTTQPAEVKHFPKRNLRAVPPDAEPPPRKALPAGESSGGGRVLPIEIDPKRVEETLAKIRGELSHWAKKGRYTKVRFKFRGKQLLPDLPFVAVVAAEGLTFYWGGILRALIFNLAGKTVFDVELVNDSEKHVQAGREALLSGDADKALSLFREALDMDRDNANAHLNLGIALKLKGDFPASREALEKARSLDPLGPFGAEAEKILNNFPKPGAQTVVQGA